MNHEKMAKCENIEIFEILTNHKVFFLERRIFL